MLGVCVLCVYVSASCEQIVHVLYRWRSNSTRSTVLRSFSSLHLLFAGLSTDDSQIDSHTHLITCTIFTQNIQLSYQDQWINMNWLAFLFLIRMEYYFRMSFMNEGIKRNMCLFRIIFALQSLMYLHFPMKNCIHFSVNIHHFQFIMILFTIKFMA